MTDWIIGGFLLLSTLNGWRHGLVRQIVSLVGVFVAYLLAKSLYPLLIPFVAALVPEPAIAPDNPLRLIPGLNIGDSLHGALAFVLLFVLAFLGIKLLGGLLDFVANLPGLSILNRLSGMVLGFVLAVAIAGILVNVLVLLPYDGLQQALEGSQLASVLLDKFSFFTPSMQRA